MKDLGSEQVKRGMVCRSVLNRLQQSCLCDAMGRAFFVGEGRPQRIGAVVVTKTGVDFQSSLRGERVYVVAGQHESQCG